MSAPANWTSPAPIGKLYGQVDEDGRLLVAATVSVSSTGSAIEDGVDNTIKATVKDYANSNPLAVITVDTNGDPTGGSAVSIANGSDVAEGATTDVAVTGDNAGTVSAKLRGLGKMIADVWDSINHRLNVYIQNTTLAVTQSGTWTVQPGNTPNTTAWKVDGSAVTQPVSAASLPLPTGAATAAKQPALGTAGTASADVLTIQGIASMTAVKVDGSAVTQPVSAASLPLPTGAATETTLGTRLTESDFDTKTGSLTETAPATDTASSGLNGRLQRIAQRITSLIALLPTSLGTKTAANSLGVTLASDDPAVATLGATTGTKVITDANGTIQQYLRGLVYLAITSGGWLVTATIAAGTALIGKVSASNETTTIYDGTTALTPKFAKIAASSSGNNAIVAAVTSKKIRVLRYSLVANGTVNAKFQSDGAGTPTDLTGLVYCVANMGIAEGYCPVGHFESGSGKSLDLNLSGAVAVGGSLTYIEV